jgi:CBS-domain-containing membrane protein
MSTPVVTIGAEADLHSTYKLFGTHAVRRLAVVDFDDFVGMITVDDLLVDLAADLFDLARPIAAEVFKPTDWAGPDARQKVTRRAVWPTRRDIQNRLPRCGCSSQMS